jgi:hypothetical protein
LMAIDNYFTWNSSASRYLNHTRQEYRCAFSVGINSLLGKRQVSIYPNPSNDIHINVNVGETASFVLFDHMGKSISNGIFHNGDNLLVLPETLSHGVYFLRINDTNYKLLYHP